MAAFKRRTPNFILPRFGVIVMYANEFETKKSKIN